ncbi:MAG: hypothetical protein R3B70_46575, partial [Polyangiaceae bacterium]
MLKIIYYKTKTVRGEGDLSARLPAAVRQMRSMSATGLGVEIQCLHAATAFGMDLRDVLLDRPDVLDDFRAISRADGIIYSFDPRRTSSRLNGAPLHNLVVTVGGAGHPPGRVPIVVVAAGRGAPIGNRLSTWEIQRMVPSAVGEVVEIDATADDEVVRVIEEVVRRIVAAQALTRSGVEANGEGAQDLSHMLRETLHDWNGSPPGEDGLLDAWNACRSPEIADLLDARMYPNRTLRPGSIDHEWWVATCRRRDPRDLPILLDTLVLWENDLVGQRGAKNWEHGTPPHKHVQQTLERIEGLRWWEDDPRMTRRVASHLADMTRYMRGIERRALLGLLERHGDPRAAAVFARALKDGRCVRAPLSFREGCEAALPAWRSLRERFPEGFPGPLVVPPEHQDA